MPSKKNKISESKLIKALAELEDVAKGDPLEDADPEGGLSTEGKPLSDAAPRGRGEQTKKSRSSASSPFGSSASSSSDDDDDDDDDAGDDESSAPFPPPKPSKKDKGKDKKKVSKAESAASSDAGSDDGSDGAEKSFRDIAEGDEAMRKGIKVNEFLESMVDQLSLALLHVSKSIAKSFEGLEARLTSHIDERVAKSTAAQHDFNARLAKAIKAIGTSVQEELVGELAGVTNMVKSLSDQPAGRPGGKAVLSKGEVNQPPWGSPGGGDQRSANGSDGDHVEILRELGTKAVADWLFKGVANNRVDQNVILAFEADRYDPATLPPAVRKAIADDLVK